MARAVGRSGNPSSPFYLLTALLTLGCSIAMLVIVNSYLSYSSYSYSGSFTYYASNVCFMQTESSQDSSNICYYTSTAAGLGISFSMWLLVMQVCSGRFRHVPACELILCLVAVCWWIGCAITGTIYGQNADDYANSSNTPYAQVLRQKEGYRTSVWALAWAEMVLWALCLLLALKDCATYRRKPPQEDVPSIYPTGACARPVYQAAPPPSYYGPPPTGGHPPPGSYPPPPKGAYTTPGQPPAGGAPAGYTPPWV